MQTKAVFIDRDGVLNKSKVINKKPYAPSTLEEFCILPDTVEPLIELKTENYILAVVTNQPDVGNGFLEKEVVEEMHQQLIDRLPIDIIKVCYHHQLEDCECRKPKPGMLIEIANEFNVDLQHSYMIGDRKSDIEAGIAVGCKTIFIDNGYDKSERPIFTDKSAGNLVESAEYILNKI